MKLRDAALACARTRFGEVPERVQRLCELLFSDESAHNVEVTEPAQASSALLAIAASRLGLHPEAMHLLLHRAADAAAGDDEEEVR